MSTNKQRRESERQRLQRQLEERREREVSRRRNTTIASVAGAIVVIAAVVVVVVLATQGGDGTPAAGKSSSESSSPSSPSASSTAPTATQPDPPLATACAAPSGATARFAGLAITGANNLKAEPKVTGKAAVTAADTRCQDLVVGKGAAVTSASVVTIQYVGVLGASGKVFGSTWTTSGPTQNYATGFIPGFKGALIGGSKVTPMHVGGRRVVVIPGKYAYPNGTPDGSIPAGSTLVFVIDLTKVSAQ